MRLASRTSKKVANNRRLIAVDCETDPAKYGRVPIPFLWGAYDGKDYWLFRTTEEFVAWLSVQKCIAYAHNGGKFDFMFLLKYVKKTKAQVINGRIVQMNFGDAELRDSFAAIPAALKQFGGKLDIDYRKLELTVRAENMPEIEIYLKQDCVALWELMDEYRKIAGKKTTLASNAYRFAKSIGLNPGKTNHTYDKNLRRYYFGGRCQVFQPGAHKNIRVIDIHSAYPFAMTHDHPCGDQWRHIEDAEFNALPRDAQQRCFITLRCMSRGAFPIRKGNDLAFPTEENTYEVTGWEYIAALDLKLISDIKILDIISHERVINFTPYVMHWYEYKDAHPKKTFPIQYEIGKRMMTNLYGKLAQNPARYYDYKILEGGTHVCDEYEYSPGNICANCGERDSEHGWEIYTEYNEVEIHRRPALWKYEFKYGKKWEGQPIYNNVATGASITGFTRAHLLRAIHSVGYKHVIYSDTDSIILSAKASLKKLSLTSALGDWADEGTASIGYFAGKKIYGLRMDELCDKFQPAPDPDYCDKCGAHYKRHGSANVTKMASKGSKLAFADVDFLVTGRLTNPKRHIIKDGERIVVWQNDFPSFSIAGEAAFVVRNIRQTAKRSSPALSH